MPDQLLAADGDAELADAMHVAEVVGHLDHFRLDRQGGRAAAALHHHHQRPVEPDPHQALDLLEALDRLVVDDGDAVVDLEAGLGGGAIGFHVADYRRGIWLAGGNEHRREDDDGEQKVRHRTGDDDRGPMGQWLVLEALPSFLLGHFGLAVGRARDTAIAEELDVAAERDPAHFPAGAGAVGPADNLPAEADRKYRHPDLAPARDQVVPELMDKHQAGQHDQKWQSVFFDPKNCADQKIHHMYPL